MNNGEIEQVSYELIEKYYELFPSMKRVRVKVVATDSLSLTQLSLCPHHKKLYDYSELASQDNYNGRMLPPREKAKLSYILLNSNKVNEYIEDKSMTWIGTVAHELTHAIDFNQMAELEQLDSCEILLERDKYLSFQNWSEYHAKKMGHYFLRKQLQNVINRTVSEDIEHILNVELPFHTNNFIQDYEATNDGYTQMSMTMRYIALLSIWTDMYPSIFTNKKIYSIIGNIEWLYDLYVFLRKNEKIEEIYNSFFEMENILKMNW